MNLTKFLNAINSKSVLKNLPDAVFIVEENGKICWVNKKAVTLFEVEKSILQNCHFEDIVNEGLKVAAKSANKRTSVITAAMSATGKEFFVELNAKFYDDQYFVTLRDVTAMTNIFNDAEETSRLTKDKNVMISKLSTDLKSPLQSMLGFSQALLDGLGGELNEKQEKYIKIINKNATDLLFFMDKFVEFAQSEATAYKADFQPFDVINTMNSIIRANEVAIASKNLTVNFDHDEIDRKTVYTDETFFKIIMQNILDTSIKLTEIGSISIKICRPELEEVKACGVKIIGDNNKYIKITVTDTGMGLTENELQDLFNPYLHLEKVNKKNIVRSFGLGAAINLTQKLHGAIWVNTEVMKGAEFNVILPIDKDTNE